MAQEFDPSAKSLVLFISCPRCESEFDTLPLEVPPPYGSPKWEEDTCNQEWEECPYCHKSYDITIWNDKDGGFVDVEGAYFSVEEIFDTDNQNGNYSHIFHETVKETISALEAISSLDIYTQKLLLRVLFANIIGSMEAYLSGFLKQKIKSTDHLKRKFIETYKPFKEIKLSLADIFSHMDNIDARIELELSSIVYHRLELVKHIYSSVLSVTFGDISYLKKCVSIRHNIIHRNGCDADGNAITITKTDVQELAQSVSGFIKSIEEQIKENESSQSSN